MSSSALEIAIKWMSRDHPAFGDTQSPDCVSEALKSSWTHLHVISQALLIRASPQRLPSLDYRSVFA